MITPMWKIHLSNIESALNALEKWRAIGLAESSFRPFNLERALKEIPEYHDFDLNEGPFCFSSLSKENLKKCESVLAKIVVAGIDEPLAEYAQASKTIREQRASNSLNERAPNLKPWLPAAQLVHEIVLRIQFSQTLCDNPSHSSDTFQILRRCTTDEKLKRLIAQWLLHGKYAYFSPRGLLICQRNIQIAEQYVELGKEEVKDLKTLHNPQGFAVVGHYFNKVTSAPSIPYYPSFCKAFSDYLNELLRNIKIENRTIAYALLARLECASEHEDVQDDDVLFDITKKVLAMWSSVTDKKNSPPCPISDKHKFTHRRTMTKQDFDSIHEVLLNLVICFEKDKEIDIAQELQQRIRQLFWLHPRKSLPVAIVLNDVNQMIVMPKEQAAAISEKIRGKSDKFFRGPSLFKIAEYNFAMNRLQKYFEDIQTKQGVRAKISVEEETENRRCFRVVSNFLLDLEKSLKEHYDKWNKNDLLPAMVKAWQQVLATQNVILIRSLTPLLAIFVAQIKGNAPCSIWIPSEGIHALHTALQTKINEPDMEKLQKDLQQVSGWLIHRFFDEIKTIVVEETVFCSLRITTSSQLSTLDEYIEACVAGKIYSNFRCWAFFLMQREIPESYQQLENAARQLADTYQGCMIAGKQLNFTQSSRLWLNTLMSLMADIITDSSTPAFKILESYDKAYSQNLVQRWIQRRQESVAEDFSHFVRMLKDVAQLTDTSLLIYLAKSIVSIASLRSELKRKLHEEIRKYVIEIYEGKERRAFKFMLWYADESLLDSYVGKRFSYLLKEASAKGSFLALFDLQVKSDYQEAVKAFAIIGSQTSRAVTCALTPIFEQARPDYIKQLRHGLRYQSSAPLSWLEMLEIIATYLKGDDQKDLQEKCDEFQLQFLSECVEIQDRERVRRFNEISAVSSQRFPVAPSVKSKWSATLKHHLEKPWTLFGEELSETFSYLVPREVLLRYRLEGLAIYLKNPSNLPEQALSQRIHVTGPDEFFDYFRMEHAAEVLDRIEEYLKKPSHLSRLSLCYKYLGYLNERESELSDLLQSQIKRLWPKLESIKAIWQQIGIILNKVMKAQRVQDELLKLDALIAFQGFELATERGIHKEMLARLLQLVKRAAIDQGEFNEAILQVVQQDLLNSNLPVGRNFSDNGEVESIKRDIAYICVHRERLRLLHEQVVTWQTRSGSLNHVIQWFKIFKDEGIKLITLGFPHDAFEIVLEQIATVNISHLPLPFKQVLRALWCALQDKISPAEEALIQRTAVVAECFASLKPGEIDKNNNPPDDLKKLYPLDVLDEAYSILRISDSDQNNDGWSMLLNQLFISNHGFYSPEVVCTASFGERKIPQQYWRQMFNEKRALLGEKGNNRHVVLPLYHQIVGSPPAARAKFLPDAPGNSLIDRKLRFLLHGREYPHQELVRFPRSTANQDEDYPVMFSEEVPGVDLNQLLRSDEEFELDPTYYSEEFLSVLVTKEHDGSPKNYIAINLASSGSKPRYRLVQIDNELIGGPAFELQNNKLKIWLRTVLFCFRDAMYNPLDEAVGHRVMNLKVGDCVKDFLDQMDHYSHRYSALFNSDACGRLFTKDRQNPILILPPVRPAFIEELFGTLTTLQILIKITLQLEGRMPTHIEILRATYPYLARKYEEVLQKDMRVEERFDEVVGFEYQIREDNTKKVKTHITLDNSSTVLQATLKRVPTAEDVAVHHNKNLKDSYSTLERLVTHTELVDSIRKEIVEFGAVRRFEELATNELREQAINGVRGIHSPINFGRLRSQTQSVLFDLFQRYPMRAYHISQSEITDSILHKILINSPETQILDLSGCAALSANMLAYVPYICPVLRSLKLNRMQVSYLSGNIRTHRFDVLPFYSAFYDPRPYGLVGVLPLHELEDLELQDNPHLTEISIFVPRLKSFKIKNCPVLKKMEIYLSKDATQQSSSILLILKQFCQENKLNLFVNAKDEYVLITLK